MSNQALSFIGRLDVMNQKAFLERLLGNRDRRLVHKLYGTKRVRDVYCPPTRSVDGSAPVMSKN